MSWQSIPDTTVLSMSDILQVEIDTSCFFGAGFNPSDIQTALAGDPSGKIGTISGTSESAADFLRPTTQVLYANLSPAFDGCTAGEIRTAVLNMMAVANQSKIVSCSQISVGAISKQITCGVIGQVTGSCNASVGNTLSLASIAVIAIILGVVFFALRSDLGRV